MNVWNNVKLGPVPMLEGSLCVKGLDNQNWPPYMKIQNGQLNKWIIWRIHLVYNAKSYNPYNIYKLVVYRIERDGWIVSGPSS